MKEEILAEYREKHNLYLEFSNVIINLLTQVLKSIPTQQITGRVKEYNSLEEKIELKNKYKRLDDITDIIGIRVITYLPDNVDKISEIIMKEFEIDKDNCIDKRIKKDDEFGYMSLHLICQLGDKRLLLPEYKRFENIKFEVQVRSVLQHTWAEIEHDIGYKSKIGIPPEINRRLYRLASLLESADVEFQNIVNEIGTYDENIEQNISRKNMKLDLNKNTFNMYLNKSEDLALIRSAIVKECSMPSGKVMKFIINYIQMLRFFGYKTLDDLDNDIQELKETIIKLAINYLKMNNITKSPIPLTIGIHYLIFINVLKCDENKRYNFINEFWASDTTVIDKIKDAYNKI